MRVHYCRSDLRSLRHKANSFNNEGFSGADLHGADSSFSHRYDETGGKATGKNLSTAITRVLVALIVTTILPGMIKYLTGVRTGLGSRNSVFVLTLMAIIVLIGTVAMATIGTLGVRTGKRALKDESNLLLN